MGKTFSVLAVVLSFSAALCAAETALWSEGISLIPYPQEVRLGGDAFVFQKEVTVVVDKDASETDRFAADDLSQRLKNDYGIAASVQTSSAGPSIVLTRAGAPTKIGGQGYELTADRNHVTVSANGESGLFYGTRTVLQLIKQCRSGLCIEGMKISDWPDIPHRAVHYDTKHHQDKAEYVREFIQTLADYKINMLIWEWEDKFAYRSHPEIGAPGAFTMAEMQGFTRYARKYHIQLVPLIQGLGHVSFILKWPQNAHLREIAASNWEFCPRKDGSYKLLFDLWDEAVQATPGSEYIHIGTDETYELGQGVDCGCKARAQEVGRRGLMLDFVGRCAQHLMGEGRKVISWGGEYRPNEKLQPPQGLITAEFTDNLDIAKRSRDAGYPPWVYDPNPGIEHLFLPYFYRLRRDRETANCLTDSHRRLTVAATSGLFDGMVCTSWDDSGLHNQVWMMRFVNAAEFSWSGGAPTLDEFIDKYFVNYYGRQATDLKELWMLLNKGAYYYMDTFERKVWHWGEIGKTHLPDLPRGDAVEYDPYWNTQYKTMVERSRAQLAAMDRVLNICQLNLQRGVEHSYDFEVFTTIGQLIQHTARTYLMLSSLENKIREAHRAHFVSNQATYQAFQDAERIIEQNLEERDKVFKNLVAVWEKTRLPKGLSTPGKKFFHQQDRARHFAFRRADMTYLIYDEQLLGLENYLKTLREYADWYRQTYLTSSGR
jgi:hexosaminidase